MMYLLMPRAERSDLSTSKVCCQPLSIAMGCVELPRVVAMLLCLLAQPAMASSVANRIIGRSAMVSSPSVFRGPPFERSLSQPATGWARLSLLNYVHVRFWTGLFSGGSEVSANHARNWAGCGGGFFASGDQGLAIDSGAGELHAGCD